MIYDDLDTFFRARGVHQRPDGSWREDSYDYGVWWRDADDGVYRLTWIGPDGRAAGASGDLYLVHLSGPHAAEVEPGVAVVSAGRDSGRVEMLCVVPPAPCERCAAGTPCSSSLDHRPAADANAESLLEGWADICGMPRSIDWLRDRAFEAALLWPDAQPTPTLDPTDRKVRGTIYSAVAAAYGYDPNARRPDDPDAPCATCGHRFDQHEGEEWEGPCGHEGCSCAAFVPAEADD